jgi:hypothetical protein
MKATTAHVLAVILGLGLGLGLALVPAGPAHAQPKTTL